VARLYATDNSPLFRAYIQHAARKPDPSKPKADVEQTAAAAAPAAPAAATAMAVDADEEAAAAAADADVGEVGQPLCPTPAEEPAGAAGGAAADAPPPPADKFEEMLLELEELFNQALKSELSNSVLVAGRLQKIHGRGTYDTD
jgi:hypothetical protein